MVQRAPPFIRAPPLTHSTQPTRRSMLCAWRSTRSGGSPRRTRSRLLRSKVGLCADSLLARACGSSHFPTRHLIRTGSHWLVCIVHCFALGAVGSVDTELQQEARSLRQFKPVVQALEHKLAEMELIRSDQIRFVLLHTHLHAHTHTRTTPGTAGVGHLGSGLGLIACYGCCNLRRTCAVNTLLKSRACTPSSHRCPRSTRRRCAS